MTKCSKCGGRASSVFSECKRCNRQRMERLREEGLAIVAKGVCPKCGQKLRVNLALTNWYQCSGFGAEGFRAPGSTPCSYQLSFPSVNEF